MEKVGRVKTIVRAFTQDSKIDPDILAKRRSICETCPLNSANVPKEELSFTDSLRKIVAPTEPHCTACGCQIAEKTAQETEECGLSERGEVPKWNRIKLETVSNTEVDLINKSEDKVNIDLSPNKGSFLIDFGKLKDKQVQKIEFQIKSKSGVRLDLNIIKPSCGSCTKVTHRRVDQETYQVEVKLDPSKIPTGSFSKGITFTYIINDLQKRNEIKLVGTAK